MIAWKQIQLEITTVLLVFEAMKANTTGKENVAIGYRALDSNTTGEEYI